MASMASMASHSWDASSPPSTHAPEGRGRDNSERTRAVKLDFEARVPVPFSVFPSAYREVEQKESVKTTHTEVGVQLPRLHRPGRESSEQRYTEEEIRIVRERESDRVRRPGVHREEYIVHEELKEQQSRPARSFHVDSRIEIDAHRHHEHDQHLSPIDKIEREYRARYQPGYREDVRITDTVDGGHLPRRPVFKKTIRVDETVVDAPYRRPASSAKESIRTDKITVDGHHRRPAAVKESVHIDQTTVETPRIRPSHKDTVRVEETVKINHTERPKHQRHHHHHHKAEMGHFDESVTIPCHHIRIGDILMLQGHPCQVIRISSSAATGQYRYLGVDLFSKQLHEESSQVHNPAPSVVVQTMRGPVMKQYRVLDLQDGQVVAMTETGDVKQALPVSEQSNLWERLTKTFDAGRGSVRVLVVHHKGQEMAVDVKTLHGSSL